MTIDGYVDRLESNSIEYARNADLSKLCSYGTGGRASVAVFPANSKQLICALESDLPYEVIGNGTNVLFSDRGYDGAIIVTSKMRGIECNGLSIVAECGTSLKTLRETAAMNSLGGLEFTEGIPATVGGAVCMNAGCFSKSVGDYVSYVVTGDGVISGSACEFGYRSSIFAQDGGNAENGGQAGGGQDCADEPVGGNAENGGNDLSGCNLGDRKKKVIVSVCFILKPGEPDIIEGKRERFKKLRKNAQPHGKSCGSVFLNDGYFAGKVIDVAGLKGYSIGGARVSEKHANFILASDTAKSADVYSLIKYVKKRVYETQGIALKEEIRYIGQFDD